MHCIQFYCLILRLVFSSTYHVNQQQFKSYVLQILVNFRRISQSLKLKINVINKILQVSLRKRCFNQISQEN